MTRSLAQLVEICRTKRFLETSLVNDRITNGLQFHFLGDLLTKNIRKEWRVAETNVNDYQICREGVCKAYEEILAPKPYFSDAKYLRNLSDVTFNFQNQRPFAISDVVRFEAANFDESLVVAPSAGTLLIRSIFINEANSKDYFYKMQRQRKIWWMKFASNPGRYSISDIRQEDDVQKVTINAAFNFGSIQLEEISFMPLKSILEPQTLEEYRVQFDKSKKLNPLVIRTSLVQEVATLHTLLDAIDSSKDEESLALHRRLAPYQLGIYYHLKDVENDSDLHDLGQMIALNLRKVGLSVLNIPKFSFQGEKIRKGTFFEADAIGIPYCIIIGAESLSNGLINLRNRDTTVAETVHLSDIAEYLLKIFRS